MEEKSENPLLKKAFDKKHKARELLEQKKPEEAFSLFNDAGYIFRKINEHVYAAECFASAANCWAVKCGKKLYFNAASRHQLAAEEYVKYNEYFHAYHNYKYAAEFFQKDNSWRRFSECFYMYKECERKEAFYIAFDPNKFKSILGRTYNKNFAFRCKNLLKYLSMSFQFIVWGYGEKPCNTIFSIFTIIFLCSIFFYFSGSLNHLGEPVNPSFFDSLYFSVITFTTLGYGDYHPDGIIRIFSMIEALGGIIIMPLFMVGLTRKYLR